MAEQIAGSVKTFNPVKGFGFLVSEAVEGDIYFKAQSLQGIDIQKEGNSLVGRELLFTLTEMKDGKYQARDISSLSLPGFAGAATGMRAAPAGDDADHGGIIKSFNDAKGFGFITSDDLEGDVYFNQKSLPEELRSCPKDFIDLVGRSVAFSAHAMPDGKQQARTLFLMPGENNEPLVGKVKSFNPTAGWGFLTSTSVEGDIYFKLKFLPPHLQVLGVQGQIARFHLNITEDGKAQANKIQFMPPGGGMGMHAMMPAMMPAMMSPMAAWSMASGVPQMGMGMWGSGGMQQMGMMKGGKGAKGGAITMGGKAMGKFAQQFAQPSFPADPSGKTLTGTVKSFNAAKGFGFIQSGAVAGDVFFKGDKVGGDIQEGTQVGFTLRMTPDGKPNAFTVTPMLAKTMGKSKPMGALKRPVPTWASGPPKKKAKHTSDGTSVEATVKSYNQAKGFGFLESAELEGDIYFQRRLLPAEYQAELPAGTSCTVQIVYTPDGKAQAAAVELHGF